MNSNFLNNMSFQKKLCLLIIYLLAFFQILTVLGAFPFIFSEMMKPSYQGGIPDFAVFWSAGKLALSGKAVDSYHIDIIRQIQQSIFPGISDTHLLPFLNPPVFFFYIIPFALFSYQTGTLLWFALPTAGYIIILSRLAPKYLILPAAFAIWPFFNSAALGQSALIHTTLWGCAAYCFLKNKKILAGIALGFLAYKPQMGLFIPLALIAQKEWKVFISASLTVAVLVLASYFVFGVGVWKAFFSSSFAFVNSMYVYYDKPIVSPHWFYGVFGLLRFLGTSAETALITHWISIALFAVSIFFIWRNKKYSLEIKLAFLILFSIFSSYYVLAYDLLALIVVGALLLRIAEQKGFYPSEPYLYLLAIISSHVIRFIHIPVLFLPWAILALILYWRLCEEGKVEPGA